MGNYSITGWSGGGRRPINYNLRAGQFRGLNSLFSYRNTSYTVNKYYGGRGSCFGDYDYGCNCGGGNSTPKWMQWMMGIGMVSSLLGNLFGLFGSFKSERGGGAAEQPEEKSSLDKAKESMDSLGLTSERGYNVNIDANGKITYTYTLNGNTITADNIADLLKNLNNINQPPAPADTEAEDDNTNTDINNTTETELESPQPASGIKVPDSWYRININEFNSSETSDNMNNGKNINSFSNSTDVAKAILQQYGITVASENVLKNLAAEITKYNPSVFGDDGQVRSDANWNKLDLPELSYFNFKQDIENKKLESEINMNKFVSDTGVPGQTYFNSKWLNTDTPMHSVGGGGAESSAVQGKAPGNETDIERFQNAPVKRRKHLNIMYEKINSSSLSEEQKRELINKLYSISGNFVAQAQFDRIMVDINKAFPPRHS